MVLSANRGSRLVPSIDEVKEDTVENVWIRTAKLVKKYKPVDLGQGSPDFSEAFPSTLKDALISTQSSEAPVAYNLYCPSRGYPPLAREIATLFGTSIERKIDSEKEVFITVGAEESLHCVINGMVEPGEEVIIFEPSYDSYVEHVEHCGGIPRYVPLRMLENGTSSQDFYIDPEELALAFNEKTKAIIINNPHNPTGKVFNREELEMIADLCRKHDCLCVSDEVYAKLVYDGEFLHVATLPGMWERTVTIGSAGKLFNCTGWKVGWTIGPEYIVNKAANIHRLILYTFATPLQVALADVLHRENNLIGTEDSYWYQLRKKLKGKRDHLCKILSECGLRPIKPAGGYFVIADVTSLGLNPYAESGIPELDQRMAEWLIKEKGIASIPVSAFCAPNSNSRFDKFIRFCFIKDSKTLDRAESILKDLKV